MSKSWNHDRAAKHIDQKIADVEEITIKDYVRDMSLESIPTSTAYRVDGVHMYADIMNLEDMLNITAVEGTECHKRTLRFLDQHYRAVKRISTRLMRAASTSTVSGCTPFSLSRTTLSPALRPSVFNAPLRLRN